MKKFNAESLKKIFLVFMLFISISIFAQPGFDDNTDVDEPVASINEWVLIIGALGIVYALYQVKKKATN